MAEHDRAGALARRKVRLADHLRAGRTVGEICDIEGLDPSNEPKRMKREVADPLGLTITGGHNTKMPLGLTTIERHMRLNLGNQVRLLRDDNHYIEVSRLIGLTNVEQRRAIDGKHNWTLAQMQRLADATSTSFEEIIRNVLLKPAIADFRLKK